MEMAEKQCFNTGGGLVCKKVFIYLQNCMKNALKRKNVILIIFVTIIKTFD